MKTGIGPFVRDGRILTYPARPARRQELLAWAVPRLLGPGETLTEAEFTRRALRLTDDTATLRRYLVDAGLVTRRPGGAGYAAAVPPPDYWGQAMGAVAADG